MTPRRIHAGLAAAVTGVLVLAACTGNSDSSGSSAGPSPAVATSSGPASSGPASPTTTGNVVTSVPGLDPSALVVMNKPPYVQGQWAIDVGDLDTGEQIISLNAQTLVEPGSVVKTYSVGAAWQKFGPDHRVTTPVKRTGPLTDGTVKGDLVLVGMGDLTMGGRTKPDGTVDYTDLDHNDANDIPGATLTPEDPLTGLNELAAQVKAAGVTTVSGTVIVDDRLWDAHALSNGPVTPIIINNNLIDFTTKPGKVGEKATIEMRPKVAPWTVTSEVRTVAKGGQTDITVTAPEEGRVVLSGTIAADSGPVVNTYAFKDPASYARTAFIEALGRAGVTVNGDPIAANPVDALPAPAVVDTLPVVAKLVSLPLEQEARYTLKISYNLGAETFICLLAVDAGSKKCSDGLPAAAAIWRQGGMDTTGASLIDGSGLPGNLITPANQVVLQGIMAKRKDAQLWKNDLPILGVDGSLALVKTTATGKVFAKTGTLGAADLFNNRLRLTSKALGGYIDTKSGRHFAFAIVASNSVFPDIEGVFAANNDVGDVVAIIQQTY